MQSLLICSRGPPDLDTEINPKTVSIVQFLQVSLMANDVCMNEYIGYINITKLMIG